MSGMISMKRVWELQAEKEKPQISKNKAIEIAMKKTSEIMGTKIMAKITPLATEPPTDARLRWSPGYMRKIWETEIPTLFRGKKTTVKIDAETGEVVGWYNPLAAEIADEVLIDKETAINLAKTKVEIPSDAKLKEVTFTSHGQVGFRCLVKWEHEVKGVPIEGDFIQVRINPKTKEVISISKTWSEVK